jgi:hypothetical protein
MATAGERIRTLVGSPCHQPGVTHPVQSALPAVRVGGPRAGAAAADPWLVRAPYSTQPLLPNRRAAPLPLSSGPGHASRPWPDFGPSQGRRVSRQGPRGLRLELWPQASGLRWRHGQLVAFPCPVGRPLGMRVDAARGRACRRHMAWLRARAGLSRDFPLVTRRGGGSHQHSGSVPGPIVFVAEPLRHRRYSSQDGAPPSGSPRTGLLLHFATCTAWSR